MSRGLIVVVLALASAAHADEAAVTERAKTEPSDQIIGVSLGMAIGGRVTPGGMRISGSYHYQLSQSDWFDGRASFTFGSGSAGCFRDRMDAVVCDHGMIDGDAVEISANVRRFFGHGQYVPFARLGVGASLVYFGGDRVSGIAFPLHGGGGLRVSLTELVSLMAEAEVEVGFGFFNRGLGGEPQVGASIAAGAEFNL